MAFLDNFSHFSYILTFMFRLPLFERERSSAFQVTVCVFFFFFFQTCPFISSLKDQASPVQWGQVSGGQVSVGQLSRGQVSRGQCPGVRGRESGVRGLGIRCLRGAVLDPVSWRSSVSRSKIRGQLSGSQMSFNPPLFFELRELRV